VLAINRGILYRFGPGSLRSLSQQGIRLLSGHEAARLARKGLGMCDCLGQGGAFRDAVIRRAEGLEVRGRRRGARCQARSFLGVTAGRTRTKGRNKPLVPAVVTWARNASAGLPRRPERSAEHLVPIARSPPAGRPLRCGCDLFSWQCRGRHPPWRRMRFHLCPRARETPRPRSL
jgi:hypothetical protein